MESVSFLSRFVAWLLDFVLMMVLAFVVSLFFGLCVFVAAFASSDLVGTLSVVAGVLIFIVLVFFEFFYFAYFWSKNGQSLGMRLTKMKVVRRNGEPLSFLRSGLRGTVGYWISGLLFGLGYLWAAIDANKEAWHDKIFDTWVVQA